GIDLNADDEDSLFDRAKSLAEQVPVTKQALKGYDTVTSIWRGLPEDPDAADIMLHAGSVMTDAASFTAECAMEAGMAVLDPEAWLVENGIGMGLQRVTPFHDALHMVSEDGRVLRNASDDFAAMCNGLVEYAGEFVRVADETLADW